MTWIQNACFSFVFTVFKIIAVSSLFLIFRVTVTSTMICCCSLGIFYFTVNKNVLITSNSNTVVFTVYYFPHFCISQSNKTCIPKYVNPGVHI